MRFNLCKNVKRRFPGYAGYPKFLRKRKTLSVSPPTIVGGLSREGKGLKTSFIVHENSRRTAAICKDKTARNFDFWEVKREEKKSENGRYFLMIFNVCFLLFGASSPYASTKNGLLPTLPRLFGVLNASERAVFICL